LRTVAPQARDLRAEGGPDIEARRVIFEIGHHLLTRRVRRVGFRHRHAGQTGVIAIGVQMQPIVMPPPG